VTAPRPRPGHGPARNDALIAGLLSAAALIAGCGSLYVSMFFAMAGDACMSNQCGNGLIMLLAYLITWGGVAAAGWLTFFRSATASRRGESTWQFPAAAIAVVIGTFIAGAMVASLYPQF
jgi:hypothetical protein